MGKEEREDGLYWIRINGSDAWHGAEWSNYCDAWFAAVMCPMGGDNTVDDDDVTEVSERIQEPGT